MHLQTESENYNDEAINSALQRLSIRQQQRQYSAHKGAGILHKEGQRRPVTTGTWHKGLFTPNVFVCVSRVCKIRTYFTQMQTLGMNTTTCFHRLHS